ncbi:MAG: hypothetical protein CVV11_19960 [Gammaproteobacteria bacterium HGW-Gammaproteobacteria-15]|nr:MAG: hypothetical protein CVV11_19960 [Gammaproteobacteria bacterium HGW-Gammaproteobacteria-15]
MLSPQISYSACSANFLCDLSNGWLLGGSLAWIFLITLFFKPKDGLKRGPLEKLFSLVFVTAFLWLGAYVPFLFLALGAWIRWL